MLRVINYRFHLGFCLEMLKEENGKNKPSQDLEIRNIGLPRNLWVFFCYCCCLFLIGTSVRLEERKHDSGSVTLWPLSFPICC